MTETLSTVQDFDARDFTDRLAQYLRTEDFLGAEGFISPFVDRLTPRLRDICRSLDADQVSTSGWERICAQIVKLSGEYGITAIGFDLSEHADGETDSAGRREPGIETSYYSDRDYPFSTTGIGAINEQIETGRLPWQGCFEDIDHALQVRGLARLHAELLALQLAEGPGRDFDFTVGTAFLTLRVYQCIIRDARAFGLPRTMPIVIGEHDFLSLYVAAAYLVEDTADHSAVVEQILASDRADAERLRLKEARGFIEELRERRENVRGWSIFNNPMKRRVFVDYCKSREAFLFSSPKLPSLPGGRNTWKLDDARFENFLLEVWRARGLGPETFPGAVSQASDGSAGGRRRTFGRKAC